MSAGEYYIKNFPNERFKYFTKVRKKAKIRNRCNQLPHLTQDTEKEGDKNTRKHRKQGTQEVSPFPKDTTNWQKQTQITSTIQKRI